MRTAHNFGLNNGLSVKDGLGAHSGTTGFTSTSSIPSGSIETIHDLSNKVNSLEQQINRAQNGGKIVSTLHLSLKQTLSFISATVNRIKSPRKSSLLLPNDPSVRLLQRQKKSLISVINKQTIGLLIGEIQTTQAQLLL